MKKSLGVGFKKEYLVKRSHNKKMSKKDLFEKSGSDLSESAEEFKNQKVKGVL